MVVRNINNFEIFVQLTYSIISTLLSVRVQFSFKATTGISQEFD